MLLTVVQSLEKSVCLAGMECIVSDHPKTKVKMCFHFCCKEKLLVYKK